LKAERAAWREEFAAVDPSRLVFVDESGASTAAVRLDGVGACLAFDGATNTVCFEAYVGECLVPTLRPGDVVVMDNLTCHKTAEVERLIAAAGAEVRYLPAYSPDLNPIEKVFSMLKAYLRSAAARTVDGLIEAMGDALRAIRPGDLLGWFRHSGYVAPPSSDTVNKGLERRKTSIILWASHQEPQELRRCDPPPR
jgi:transposase